MSDSSGSDSFTETTHTSWLGRIQQAIGGVLIGLVLIIGACVLLFWNEGRAVQTARSLTEGGRLVVDVGSDKVDPANEGKLIHVSGDLKAVAPLVDPDFAISAAAIRLIRTVEMFQWKEETKTETQRNVGGSQDQVTTYSYVKVWSATRNDSAKFKHPDGHANPQPRYAARDVAARDATLGAFRPSEKVVRLVPADEQLRVDAGVAARLHVSGPAQVLDGKIYLGADPTNPAIGDLSISYKVARAGPVSIIGRQSGADIAEFQTTAGDRLLQVVSGTASAEEMFKSAEAANRTLTWILRGVGAVLMFVGWLLLWRPFVVVADVIPLIGSVLGAGVGIVALLFTTVLAPLVIAIAWFRYRPVVAVVVLVFGIVVTVALKMVLARKAAAPATR